MKKILVPCDFSVQAVNAFRMAMDMAHRSSGEVHLVNVVEIPVVHDSVLMPAFSFEETMLGELRENARQQFAKLVAAHGREHVKVVSNVEYGATAPMISTYVNDHEIDMIVMGTKGVSGVKEFIVGSNAEKIVRSASCPVMVVRNYVDLQNIKNIVFPNSLDEDEEDLMLHLKALQAFFKATLHVVWINTPNSFVIDSVTHQRLQTFTGRYMLKDFTVNVYNDRFEENGIINFTHAIKADMIAMGTHGRKGLAHLLSGSLTEDVVNHVDCPIWTYTIKRS